eukprot:gnl/Chilomastix_cuspidata/407.p2 GENE.gnl/Chilomastix_cuspidata/407~~gnl/Chilomastix_cuspidata/407.p2  ORF type:complete len:482 (-),score=281.81 gnl/Chilomastix_cuspidata/407:6-1451(-)
MRKIDTQAPGFRYFMLFLGAMFTFGSYYAYDMPSVCMTALTNSDGSYNNDHPLTTLQYNWLYSIYSLMNFISVLFGGFIIDRFGFSVSALFSSGFLCVGQAILALGVTLDNNFVLMLVGRGVFGVGGGNIGTCQNCVFSYYFKGKELSMSFSIGLAVSRLGSVLNFFTTSYLIDNDRRDANLPAVFWMGCGLCAASLVFIVAAFFLNRLYERDLAAAAARAGSSADGSDAALLAPAPRAVRKRAVEFRDIRLFNATYWLLDVLCGFFYSCIFVFISISTDFIHVKYAGADWAADDHIVSIITGIVYDVSLVVSTPFGILVDKLGHRVVFQFVADVLLLPGYLLFALTDVAPWWPNILFGVSYSFMAASLWSSVPLVVPLKAVGTALSFMTAVQMLFNTVFQQVIGALTPQADDGAADPAAYNAAIYAFCAMAALCIVLDAVVLLVDRRDGSWLLKTSTAGKFAGDEPDAAAAPDSALAASE